VAIFIEGDGQSVIELLDDCAMHGNSPHAEEQTHAEQHSNHQIPQRPQIRPLPHRCGHDISPSKIV
jgi:hypothetical protein